MPPRRTSTIVPLFAVALTAAGAAASRRDAAERARPPFRHVAASPQRAVPEQAGLPLLGAGLAFLALARRRAARAALLPAVPAVPAVPAAAR